MYNYALEIFCSSCYIDSIALAYRASASSFEFWSSAHAVKQTNKQTDCYYDLHSQHFYLLNILKIHTNMGKRVFSYAASFDWKQLKDQFCLKELVSFNSFKCILNDFVLDLLYVNIFVYVN